MRITIDVRASQMEGFVCNNLTNILNKTHSHKGIIIKEFDKYIIFSRKTERGYSIIAEYKKEV